MWQIHKFKFSRDVTFCTASHFAPCTSSGVRLLPFVQSQYRYRFTSSTSTWVIVNLLCLCNAVFSAALRLSELFWHCTCWQNTLLYEGDGDKFSIFFSCVSYSVAGVCAMVITTGVDFKRANFLIQFVTNGRALDC